MSKNGCEAIPIESPSSIHSDSPSESCAGRTTRRAGAQHRQAARSCSAASDARAGDGTLSDAGQLGDPSERAAGPSLPIAADAGHPMASSGASLVAVLPAAPPVGANGLASGQSEPAAGGTVSSRHLPLVHQPVAVVGGLGHERAVGHGRVRNTTRAAGCLRAHLDPVDAQLVGHHLGLERAAVDAAAGEQPSLPPASSISPLRASHRHASCSSPPARVRCCRPWP